VIDLETPLVIGVALTGMVPRFEDSPHVPLTPAAIAADVERCYAAGARNFHIHARDDDGAPTYRREVYAAIIRAIKARVPDAILCVSTSGRDFGLWEQRADVLQLPEDLKPALASLTLGSLNFPQQASVNAPETIDRLARTMHERGIVPELEVFELGMLDIVPFMVRRGALRPPYVCNILLGSRGTMAATAENLGLMVNRLPAGCFWAAAGIGRFQYSMNVLAIAMGGHVRTGLEDNLYLDTGRTELATNEGLVRRLADVAAAIGRPLATTEQARALLGLR
jgi:uncharacterized protein (DUF849 family)